MDELIAKLKAFARQPGPSRRLVAILLSLVVIVAFIISTLSSDSPTDEASPSSTQQSVSIDKPSFYVHIVGAVVKPGIYSLEVGSRLFDAVIAAGGFLPKADQSSVNLARTLTDGEQVSVLKIGEQQAITSGLSNSGPSSISVNRATQAELETLPGVGPALAGRIIDWRTANGGFKRLEDLKNVGGIGDKLFSGFAKQITL
jgi:competence protein ComEA